jgi:Cu(I)/Ag(I) efflux system membrane protein CusA/SilA
VLNRLIRFFLENKLVAVLLFLIFAAWGIATAPFDWDIPFLPRDPVPVDAIPDIGENQQIVFTEWMGRSPRDVEDQITYPLTASLLGLPGVTSIRSTSMFGFSSVTIIFHERVEYYWSRSRVLEKLNTLPGDLLPPGVTPVLGPDATALGQIFWYTLEGRDGDGRPAGGWDLHELRAIQDFQVRPALAAAEGVSEVASVGGFVKEYQVDLDPAAMQAHGVGLMEVVEALLKSNRDVGANTVEFNLVEYYVRGLGAIQSLDDIEQAVVRVADNVPLRILDIARVTIGPAPRGHGGVLDKGGAEAVGGVVVARFGENPLKVIQNVKKLVEETAPGLPSRILEDGRTSRVTIVPFYDRTQLIHETLGTLREAISLQILITLIVVVVMVFHLRASLMISALLPLAVVMCFIMMRQMRVDANIVALSGIAIAIGTMVDLGIILSENILRHEKEAPPGRPLLETVFEASAEVSSAILTAVSTTIVSFLPVFTLQAAEGKLFRPLAFTKTFALVAALVITFLMIPALAHGLLSLRMEGKKRRVFWNGVLLASGLAALFVLPWAGLVLAALGANNLLALTVRFPDRLGWVPRHSRTVNTVIIALGFGGLLAAEWRPLGVDNGLAVNLLFIVFAIGLVLGGFKAFIRFYPRILGWCLAHKTVFLLVPTVIVLAGVNIWRGMGKEFMPSLDEGAFLLMPTSMPHSGVEANLRFLSELDRRAEAVPEVETVVGKAGRAESALDPAPLSMFENIILYKSEFKTDTDGRPMRFKVDAEGAFVRDEGGRLVPDPRGRYFRQWRDHIRSPDDIWDEIVRATRSIPGVTSAPKLQPIETRLVMLQTGLRAPMGLKVFGPDLKTIEEFSLALEDLLKEVPSIKPESVFADRSLGKPYLEIDLDRRAMARHGLNVEDVQHVIETAVGGMALTTTVEGRERFAVRARYAREWRDDPETLKRAPVSTPSGTFVPLGEIAEIGYRSGPMMIRGENAFLVGYVLFDRKAAFAEVTVVEEARRILGEKIASGQLDVPPGVRFQFSGSYENQVRASRRLAVVIPLVLAVIFLILYFQFRSASVSLMIFSAVALAFAGGFLMLWLYGQPWFMDVSVFGVHLRDLFNMKTVNLSVAVWVGFIALFGIATDDGVVIATYLKQSFRKHRPEDRAGIRGAVLEAGVRRVRPCLMTTATTLLALLPVLTSSGRGADIMIPMAIPAFGGMTVALITLFVVPVLYAAREEFLLGRTRARLRKEERNP